MQLWETASSGVNLSGSCVTSSDGETLKKLTGVIIQDWKLDFGNASDLLPDSSGSRFVRLSCLVYLQILQMFFHLFRG